MAYNDFSPELYQLADEAEVALRPMFDEIEKTAFRNTERVMYAFRENRISAASFAPSDGYGYGDSGRDAADAVYAQIFGCDAAFVRHNIISGTQALTIALFGLLRPGDTMLSVTGRPYDTLTGVIGIGDKPSDGSLAEWGVNYDEVALGEDFTEKLRDERVKMVYIQRSKGYFDRPSLSPHEISTIYRYVKTLYPEKYVVVDNCYGEFTDTREPEADLLVGSLIKNPGGGMASCGGYIAGSARAVELASYRWSCPEIGVEAGASLGETKNILKGIFYAPHTVAQALKTALFAAFVFEKKGYAVSPNYKEKRNDIIQTVSLGSPGALCAFCRGIQTGSPVDSFVTPEPWAMPGYPDPVIMAAGTFVGGASIELSADGPMRAPYTAFMQGGLTYESGKFGILTALAEIENSK